MPIIKMLSTGDEVLHGQIVDSNAAWLAHYFFQNGAALSSRYTVGDNLTELVNTIQQQVQTCDILIINGGLGPTSDDLTSEAVALALRVPLIYYPECEAEIKRYFSDRQQSIPRSNFKQALLPQGAKLFTNPIGTACGFMLQYQQCQIYCTPGVPTEFKQMIVQQIYPFIQQYHHFQNKLICLSLTVLGYSESELADLFSDLSLPNGITLGFRAEYPTIEIKLTASHSHHQEQLKYWALIQQRLNKQSYYTPVNGVVENYPEDPLLSLDCSLILLEGVTAGRFTQQLTAQQIPFQRAVILPSTTPFDLIEWQQQVQQFPLEADQLLVAPSGLFLHQLYFAIRSRHATHYWRFNYHYPIKTAVEIQNSAVILAQHLLKQYVILNNGKVVTPHWPIELNIYPFELYQPSTLAADKYPKTTHSITALK